MPCPAGEASNSAVGGPCRPGAPSLHRGARFPDPHTPETDGKGGEFRLRRVGLVRLVTEGAVPDGEPSGARDDRDDDGRPEGDEVMRVIKTVFERLNTGRW